MFRSFDRHNTGTISELQFQRVLPTDLKVSENEIDTLLDHLRQDDGRVNYQALVSALREAESFGVTATDGRAFMQTRPVAAAGRPAVATEHMDVTDVLRRAFHTCRIRPTMFFQDYDKFHSGRITENQFVRGLTLAFDHPGLRGRVRLTAVQLQQVVEQYKTPEGEVDYKTFCRDSGGAFVVPIPGGGADVELETQPEMLPPNVSRKDVVLNEVNTLRDEEESAVNAVIADLKHQVTTRRIDMYSIFSDFDTGCAPRCFALPSSTSALLQCTFPPLVVCTAINLR
jgi:Ca2+-binding EF-hand superfamily protein